MPKDSHRKVDISKYIDIASIFEDPWAELMQNMDNSTTSNKTDVSNRSSSITDSKEISEGISLDDKYIQNNQSNAESPNQSVNTDLEISDSASNVTNISHNESGDTKLDSTSNNQSSCNNSNDNDHAKSKDIEREI